METAESDRRLGELLLYVATKCEGDPTFGATKLNKILFLSDFLAFQRLGQSITGAEYMRLERGPAPRRLVPVREALVARRDAAVREKWLPLVPRPQQRLIALREPDLSLFTANEIALVDAVIEAVRPLNGTELSQYTHQFVGWLVAEDGETIPYESALLSMEPPTDDDLRRTRELVEEHGW